MAHGPDHFGLRSVGPKPGQIAFVLFPADVGREAVLDQRVVVFVGAGHPTAARASRLLFARIHLAATLGIGPRINRIFQQILQGHPVGPAPFQFPLGQPFAYPHPQLNIVLVQVA
jgi:hypothetical protein